MTYYEIRLWDNNAGISAQEWWCYETRFWTDSNVASSRGAVEHLGSGSASSKSSAYDCAVRMAVHHRNKQNASWEQIDV